MLKSITLENFRSIKDRTRISIGELTILVGANSAGKSTVSEALSFLKHAMRGDTEQIYNFITSAEHRYKGEASGSPDHRESDQLKCGASFLIDEISKETRFSREYEEADALNISDYYPFQELIEAFDGCELEVIFTSLSDKIEIFQDGELAISIDSHLYAWDGRDSIRRLQFFATDPNCFFDGRLVVYKQTPFGKQFDKTLCNVYKSWPQTYLGEVLRNEAYQNLTFYGISSDSRDSLYLPKYKFDPSLWQEHVDTVDFIAVEGELSSKSEERIYKRVHKDFKIKWPLRGYAEYCEAVNIIISAIIKVIYRRLSDYLDMPHVPEARLQLGSAIFEKPTSYSHKNIEWQYAEALCAPLYTGFLAKPLRKYLSSQEFLGKYEIACDITAPKIQNKSYLGARRQKVGSPPTANFFLIDKQGRYLHFNEVGSGASFLFPIFAAMGGSKPIYGGYPILIQQPELHLHPAAQCEVADLLLWFIQRRGQVIIETHSEHLILRILKRVRQEFSLKKRVKVLPLNERVIINSFQQTGGISSIKNVRIARNGDFLDDWPGGFFAERESELFDE